MESTFIMVKPDGVQKGQVGEIIKRIEQKGFKLVGLKLLVISRDMAEKHYEEHKDKPFFGELVEFITSGPVVAMVWEGPGVIDALRNLMGKTNPAEALPGTIRGDLAVTTSQNIIHGSDSWESAQREIDLFFSPLEIIDYQRVVDKWAF
ncbi:MAG: nucleoside-diphosphate kinase [Syntrophomonadaceae bacterium]